jgi:transcriptional regulator
MYTPAAFAETDRATLHALIAHHGFGLLVSVRDGAPVVSHLPFVADPAVGSNGTLYAHIARGNPQWRDFGDGQEVLAIFSGPHGYISPRWYRPGNAVPTWNYAVVHAWGVPRIVADPDEVRRQQDSLIAAYEGTGDGAWSLVSQPADYADGMLRGIVAFELPITRLEGKFKLSQNRPAEDAVGVIAGLRATGRPDDAALADLMASRKR